jgi:hypothetical protein
VVLVLVLFLAGSAGAAAHSATQPGIQKILLRGQDAPQRLQADLAKQAALDLYCDGQHPFSACSEQGAVDGAFGAIGYPPADLGCDSCEVPW